MLIKSKVCFTVLVIYEIIAVSVLHIQRMCDAIFTTSFCDTWFRYFIFCVALPLIVMLIWMWIREIVRAHRRRAFIRRAKSTVNGIMSTIRGKVTEHIAPRDMEKIITAAILVGIKKYTDKHPNLRHNVNRIMDVANGDSDIEILESEDIVRTSRTQKRASKPAKTSAKNKK